MCMCTDQTQTGSPLAVIVFASVWMMRSVLCEIPIEIERSNEMNRVIGACVRWCDMSRAASPPSVHIFQYIELIAAHDSISHHRNHHHHHKHLSRSAFRSLRARMLKSRFLIWHLISDSQPASHPACVSVCVTVCVHVASGHYIAWCRRRRESRRVMRPVHAILIYGRSARIERE